jgi:myosin heavy subunit
VSHESHSQETTRLKETLQTLELTMNHLEQRNQVLQEKEHQRLTLQQNAVKEALQLQRQEHVQDIQRQQEHFVKEKESLKQEYTRMIEKLSETHAQREDEHRRIEENFRFEAKRTASQHEQEISRLRDEYQILQSQLTLVKEKTQHQLQEERTMHEKSLSEQLAASLKTHAATKTEMATMLQQLHLEENKRRQETELQFNRLREQMLAQHQVELEQLRDKQARELKRARAELEVQFEDQANKLKHMHEQELNRQIRITDRFQRVFARHGLGPSAKNSASSEEVSPAALRTLQQAMSQEFQHSLTPKRLRQQQRLARQPLNTSTTSLATRGENFPSAPAWNNPVGSQAGGEEDDDEEEEEIDVLPPPPPPASYMSRGFTNTKTRGKPPSAVSSFAAAAAVTNTNAISTTSSSQNHGTSSLNWGALSDSLRAQGASAPSSSSSSSNSHGTFSPQHPPPNTFALDEAVASSSNPQVTQKGLGITANVRRMSSYLQALEDYLQGDETAAQDVNISIATSTALSDILNVPVSSAAIQTAVPLGQDKKAGPQASRKTENSDKLRDSLATSTNNTVSVVDEDTNSTGSLLRHLRGLHQTSTSTVDEVAMRDAGAKEEDDDGDEASYGDDAADWMYVASDSEDSLHRAARSSGFQTQLKTMTATTQQPNPSVLSSISSTGPLLTTVLSDS